MTIIFDLTGFQIEAIAFPVSKSGFDPKALATLTPSISSCWSMTNYVSRVITLVCPVNHQMGVTPGMLLGQGDVMNIASRSLRHSQSLQSLPLFIAWMEKCVRFNTQLPSPIPIVAELLHFDRSKLSICIEHDAFALWKIRLDFSQ